MNSTNEIRQPLTSSPSAVEIGEEALEYTGGGLRIVEVALVVFLGLLICPPLLILAVVVAAPLVALALVVAAVAAAVVVPTLLVRRVLAHHREHHSTLFLHRLLPR
jgi:hypothetical protein